MFIRRGAPFQFETVNSQDRRFFAARGSEGPEEFGPRSHDLDFGCRYDLDALSHRTQVFAAI
jgi:hypothetical protein